MSQTTVQLINVEAVDSTAIKNSSIDTIDIADSAVTTAKIADLNVTTAKIASDASITKVVAPVTGYLKGADSAELVRGNMADNDWFRILVGGTGSNAGYVEIATGDDGNEPIYVKQYGSGFTRMATLLNESGNTIFPGDITAFASDERLKTNIKPLVNALDKVSSLRGFTYNFNETGKTLGFDTETVYVGVSAQEVQAVLPEAVKPAPVDNKYNTVQYEKLVPLLIEAIKELKIEIDELKGGK